jgi:hypothetical protein
VYPYLLCLTSKICAEHYWVLLVTGVGFLCGQPWAVSTLAASCLVLLLGSAKGAWDMLIWFAATGR